MNRHLFRLLAPLATAVLAACGGGETGIDPPACTSSPADSVHVAQVCLTPADLGKPAAIAEAKAAYANNAAIVLTGGSLAQLRAALGIVSPGDVTATVAPGPSETPAAEAIPLIAGMVATAVRLNGSVSDFSQMIEEGATLSAADLESLQEWRPTWAMAREPGGPNDAWMMQYTTTSSAKYGNDAALTGVTAFYRLNGNNTKYDYFMVTNTNTGSSVLKKCDSPFAGKGNIGIYALNRRVGMFLSRGWPGFPGITIYDAGPNTSVGSSSTGFTVGANLSAAGPGLAAGYSQSYSASDVGVKREQYPSDASLVEWGYSFKGPERTPKVCPPPSSYNSYSAPQATIYQVPKGGQALAIVNNAAYFTTQTWTNILGIPYDIKFQSFDLGTQVSYVLRQPLFEATPATVEIAGNNGAAQLNITATFEPVGGGWEPPQVALGWAITNIPLWLIVSRVSGAGSAVVQLTAQPNTAPGSTAQLNINTVPGYAANSVGSGPLVVKVVAR